MTDQLPTARELEALKVLWERKNATVREIHGEMVSGQNDLAYTTVLSLIQTMEKKGLIGRESEGRGKTHSYFAKVRAEKTMRSLAGDFLENVFDGAVGQYLVRAIEARRPSPEELDELERMIALAKEKLGESKSKSKGSPDV